MESYSSMNTEPIYILSAEYFGEAEVSNGMLDIGGVSVPWHHPASIYVRRVSNNLSIAEIHIVDHDGMAQEMLDAQNEEADRYPLGPKEYWRGEMVGKYTCGADGHLMTNEDFEADWD